MPIKAQEAYSTPNRQTEMKFTSEHENKSTTHTQQKKNIKGNDNIT